MYDIYIIEITNRFDDTSCYMYKNVLFWTGFDFVSSILFNHGNLVFFIGIMTVIATFTTHARPHGSPKFTTGHGLLVVA